MSADEVVLVDEKNHILGTMPKAEAHQKKTPLHRAFSAFIFNKKGELLLQKRSHNKKTWPGVWSNSCCGHPVLGEDNVKAAKRRISEELGLKVKNIKEIAPYRYKFSKNGIMENEICPIIVVFLKSIPKKIKFDKKEVGEVRWVDWGKFLQAIAENPKKYSPWCVEQAKILNSSRTFCLLYRKE
jgi:isopentenyl-diphosphate delta-isomerase